MRIPCPVRNPRISRWSAVSAILASTLVLSCDLFDSKKSKEPEEPPAPIPVVLSPTISPVPGESTATTPVTVVVSSATAGSWVCWTVDGSEPTDKGSCADTARIYLDSSALVKARAYANGMTASSVASARYEILLPRLSTPRIAPDSGSFDSAVAITIENTDSSYGSGWEFHYTTDGTEPTLHSARYEGTFRLGHDATVKARLWAPGRLPSGVVSGKFTFSRSFDLSGKPSITPRDATFDTSVVVVIAPPQAGCEVRYTTDSTEPTQWSRQSYGQILLERSARVKAKAWCQDMYGNILEPSATDSTDITIRYKPAIVPVFSPKGGTYDSVQYVSLTSPTPGSTIRYTIDGREPTTASALYRGSITLRSTTTIKAVAFAPDRPASDVVSATFTLQNVPTSDKPVISGKKEASSSWSGDTVIRVSIKGSDFSGTVLRYTLDGTTPTESSPIYRESFVVDGVRMVKARSFRRGMLESAVDSEQFTPRLSRALAPTFTPDSVKYSPDSVQYIYLSTKTPGCQIRYTVDGSVPTSSSTLYAGLPITLSKTTTIKAIALASSREASPVASATWTLKPSSAAGVKISTTAKLDSSRVYTTIVRLSMTTATSDATIRYTLDGSDPGESSPVFSSSIALEASDTVKARAFCRGLLPSPVTTFGAIINLVPCEAVEIADSLSGPGGYRAVRLSSATDSVQIWYGYGDGSATPYQYQSPFLLSSTTKIHAVARKYGRAQSKLSTREIKVVLPVVPKPRISPRDTTAKDVVRVGITDSLSNATIWYSRYGYDRTQYTGTFDVEDSVTKIIAWAEAPGYARSANDTVTIKVSLPGAGAVRHKLAQGIYGSVQYDTIVADSSSATVWVSIDDGSYVQHSEGRAIVRLDHYARVRAYATMSHRLKGATSTAWYDIRLPKAAKPLISPRGGFSDTVVKATISTTDGLSTWYRIGYGNANAYKKGQILSFSSNSVLTAWNTGTDKLQSDVDSVSWTIQLRPVDTLLADKSAGYYDTGLVVKLSTATKGATIWVRLDPANGTSGTGVLRQLDSTSRIRIDSSAILHAYATAEGRAASSPIRIRYDVRRYTAPKPESKKDTLGRLILSTTLPGAQILYQVNAGSVQATSSGSSLPLGVGRHVVTSWTAKPGWLSSPQRVDTIRLAPSAPTISPNGGTVASGSVVSMRSPDGLPIRYTLDGKTPTQSSPEWNRDLVLTDSLFGKDDSLVLKAQVWADSIPSSEARAVLRRMGRVASVVANIPDTAKLDTGAVVVLRSATKGATVWWRLKGSDDYRGSVDSVRIPLDSSLVVEAYASKTDMQSSATSTFSWKVPRYGVATPSISPRSGTFGDSSVQVSIKTATPKAQIYYMLNAAGPYAYTAPFRIEKTSVVTAYATRPGWNKSALDSVYIVFDTTVAAPKFSPSSGVIASGAKVSITGPANATIRYTLDGSEPAANSPIYETPLSINVDSVVVKARAWVGSRSSAVTTARYTLARDVKFNVWMKPHGGSFTDSVSVAISCGGCSDTTLLLSSFGRDTLEALANAKAQDPSQAMKIRTSGKAWLLLVGAKSKALLSWDSASFAIGKTKAKADIPMLRRDTLVVKDGSTVSFQDSVWIIATRSGRGDYVAYRNMCTDTTWGQYANERVKFSNTGTCVAKFWTTSDSLATSDTVRVTLVGSSSAIYAPKFSPSSGTILPGTKVAISGSAGAIIRYTLDGSEPTSGSILYEAPISINVDSVVLKARAWVGSQASAVATTRYTLLRYNVWMKPHGGSFTDSVVAAISCTGCSDTTILYSSFGKTQEEALAKAKMQDSTRKLTIRSSGTAWLLLMGARSQSVLAWDSAAFTIVQRIAAPTLMRDSNIAAKNGDSIKFRDSVRIIATPGVSGGQILYNSDCDAAPAYPLSGALKMYPDTGICRVDFWTSNGKDTSAPTRVIVVPLNVMKPVFMPASVSTLKAGDNVSIRSTHTAEIRYTFDGTDPTLESPLYSTPLSINVDSTIIKARAWLNGRTSDVATARYFLAATVKPKAPTLVRWGGGLDGDDTLDSGDKVSYYDTLQIMVRPDLETDTVWEVDRCSGEKRQAYSVYRSGIWNCDVDFYSTRNGVSSDTIRLYFTGKIRAPQFALNKPGTYTDSVRVAIISSGSYWKVAYSIDGVPMVSYADPFLLSKTATIRARTYTGADSGEIATGTYTIVPSHQDTVLQYLAVTSGALLPSFDIVTLAYKDTIATASTTIKAIPRSSASKVWIDGVQRDSLVVTLDAGQTRMVRVVVKSSRDSLVYTVNVVRKVAVDPAAPIPWNSAIAYGTLPDSRDGKTYKTVKIGTQTWMAENLSFWGNGSDTGYCYANSKDSCAKYGRLYTWSTVMAGASSSTTSPSGVQGICPDGWHVPSDSEWDTLMTAVGGTNIASSMLKSAYGWTSSGNGTDTYGFRALPAGDRNADGSGFWGSGSNGLWWCATEYGAEKAWYHNMFNGTAIEYRKSTVKSGGFSVRCLQD